MAKNKGPVSGKKAAVLQSAANEPAGKPRHLGKAEGPQSTATQLKQLGGSKTTQQQNPTSETRQGMPRPGYKRKGVVLPDAMIKALKHRAVDLGVTDSELVERAVREFLKKK